MKKNYILLAICLLMAYFVCFKTITFAQNDHRMPVWNTHDLRNGDTLNFTNLVIFIRFADDDEITHPIADIDSMFNGKTEGYLSIYNFYKVFSYGKLHYNTVYADQIQDGQVHSYVDIHPRGYYEPFSDNNPIGYHGDNPLVGISMREAQLLARAIHYVDSLGLVSPDVVLDGDGDGDIDNISFVVKGGTGAWASILWPHMEFFPQDSIDYPVSINGVAPYTFNFEFEGDSPIMFSPNVFRHEMAHSLNIPDIYHYIYYPDITPAGSWDMMGYPYVMNQTNVMYKYKYLNLTDEPIQITEDGTYTLYSNASSPTQNCYYIKSSIDSTQWFTFEFRNQADLFDDGIPGTGLIAARWNDTVALNYQGMFGNAFFDFYNYAHQYWIFRPGSNCDTINGSLGNAHFSAATGRTSFGPTTDPYPYLTDGTPEQSFEITDIQEYADHLTFHVHFFNSGVSDVATNEVSVYPNPATDQVSITGNGISRVEVFSLTGQLLHAEVFAGRDHCSLSLQDIPAGMLVLRITQDNGAVLVKKIVISN